MPDALHSRLRRTCTRSKVSSFWVLLRPCSFAQDSLSEQGPHLVVDEDTEGQREVPSKGAYRGGLNLQSISFMGLWGTGPYHPLMSLFHLALLGSCFSYAPYLLLHL